jgi:RNA polymerase sigma factor (TIGR02999 family)
MQPVSTELSAVLARIRQGDRSALEELVTLLYPELRRRAAHYLRSERRGHTLQPTALVNEAYLRLFHVEGLKWNDRAHFLATMAQQMRRILVDYARARNAQKGPGAQVRVELGDVASLYPSQPIDLLAIDQALTHLAAIDPRASRVVELRFFGGSPRYLCRVGQARLGICPRMAPRSARNAVPGGAVIIVSCFSEVSRF